MKRLFRIGSGLFIYSITPIASWLVLAIVLGDNRISNVFSLTYAMQFVWAILRQFFGTGANIRKEKEKDENSIWNSIFWGVIFSAIIFSLPIIFVDKYIMFFGQDIQFYKIFIMYSIALLFLQTLLSFIIEKFYFEDREKLANFHLLSFNLITFGVLILSCLIIKTTWVALFITLLTLLIYIIILYVKEFKKFKINFRFLRNFRYESASIVSNIFMMLIYLFGFKNAFLAGPEYLTALNLVGLCTDTQWDMMEAITTVAKVDISKNRFNYTKQVKESYIYTICIMLTSIIMVLALFNIYGVVLNIALIYLAIDMGDMLLNPYTKIIQTYTQIEYSPILNTIISLGLKVCRFIVSVIIFSPYCTGIGQISQEAIAFVIYLIIRITKYKIADKTLTLKKVKV